MDVAYKIGQKQLLFRSFEASELAGTEKTLQLQFELFKHTDDVEVRLFCHEGFKACFSSLQIMRCGPLG
jgi:hypothetical protein